VIIPSYKFKQAGRVNFIGVRVFGPTSPLALQVWRPTADGSHQLHWYATLSENTGTLKRVNNEVSYEDQSGFPVREGDVLGFHTLPSPDPISVVFYQDLELEIHSGEAEVYYLEGVGNSLCRLSLCNESMQVVVSDGLPFIQTHGRLCNPQ
jgi:hypothetical protein